MSVTAETLEYLQTIRNAFKGKEEELQHYLEHDFDNHLGAIVPVYGAISGEELAFDRSDYSSVVALYKTVLDRILAFDPDQYRPSLAREIRRAPHVRAAFPALDASFRFFNDPTELTLANLREVQVPLAAVLRVVGADTLCHQGTLINGARAMIAINLAGNAETHSVDKRFMMVVDPSNYIVVSNISENPLPNNFADFGVKGKTGRRGYGAFFSKRLADLEDISISVNQTPLPQGWRISMSFPISGTELEPFPPMPLYQLLPAN